MQTGLITKYYDVDIIQFDKNFNFKKHNFKRNFN